MSGPTPEAAELVQRAAGVIAAKHRGDLAGAADLLAAFPGELARPRGVSTTRRPSPLRSSPISDSRSRRMLPEMRTPGT